MEEVRGHIEIEDPILVRDEMVEPGDEGARSTEDFESLSRRRTG